MPSLVVAPATTMFPAVLHSFPPTLPPTFLGVGHLVVRQGLDTNGNRSRVSGSRNRYQSGCAECCKKTAHHSLPGTLLVRRIRRAPVPMAGVATVGAPHCRARCTSTSKSRAVVH